MATEGSIMTSSTIPELYRRAQDTFGERVHGVRADQWRAPTPCTDWDVRSLVNHVVGENRWAGPWFAPIAEMYRAGGAIGPRPEVPPSADAQTVLLADFGRA